jgi:cytochrome c5
MSEKPAKPEPDPGTSTCRADQIAGVVPVYFEYCCKCHSAPCDCTPTGADLVSGEWSRRVRERLGGDE